MPLRLHDQVTGSFHEVRQLLRAATRLLQGDAAPPRPPQPPAAAAAARAAVAAAQPPECADCVRAPVPSARGFYGSHEHERSRGQPCDDDGGVFRPHAAGTWRSASPPQVISRRPQSPGAHGVGHSQGAGSWQPCLQQWPRPFDRILRPDHGGPRQWDR